MRGVCLRRETCPDHTVQWHLPPGAPRLPCLALLSLCPQQLPTLLPFIRTVLVVYCLSPSTRTEALQRQRFLQIFFTDKYTTTMPGTQQVLHKMCLSSETITFLLFFFKMNHFLYDMKIMYVHYWGKMTILKSIKQRKYIALYPTMTAVLKFW